MPAVDPILLSIAQISTFVQNQERTNATGFFFKRDERLYLITSRHVVIDENNNHFPDRIQIKLFTNTDNLAQSANFSIPLYQSGKAQWIQAKDSSGTIDVVAIELKQNALPGSVLYQAFSPHTLCQAL